MKRNRPRLLTRSSARFAAALVGSSLAMGIFTFALLGGTQASPPRAEAARTDAKLETTARTDGLANTHPTLGTEHSSTRETSSAQGATDRSDGGEDATREASGQAEPAEGRDRGAAASGDMRRVYTDAAGQPLSGTWRYEGVDYVFDGAGHILAGGGTKGTKGRLYVPSAGIDVAVNHSDAQGAQYYTDLEDSAAYVHYGQGAYYMADHSTQAFSTLAQVRTGDVAYLFSDRGIEAFVCTTAQAGHNTGSRLTDASGHDIASVIPTSGFCAYTCLDSWTNVQIVYWRRTWIASTDSSAATVRLNQRNASSEPMESTATSSEMPVSAPVSIDPQGPAVPQSELVAPETTPAEESPAEGEAVSETLPGRDMATEDADASRGPSYETAPETIAWTTVQTTAEPEVRAAPQQVETPPCAPTAEREGQFASPQQQIGAPSMEAPSGIPGESGPTLQGQPGI